MTATCLRCDYEDETEARACPRCGAPLYRSRVPSTTPRAAARPSTPGTRSADVPAARTLPGSNGAPPAEEDERPPATGRPVTTSPRSVFLMVGTVFAVVVFLLSRGGEDLGQRPVAPSPTGRQPTGGLLVYAVAEQGASRLYRWDLVEGTVREGPLVSEPLAIVNVKTPAYGWLGLTSNLGNGVLEASVLDSLRGDAVAQPVGRGDVVTWVRQGATVVLVDRGPLQDACRRQVSVDAVHVVDESREEVLRTTICGDVLTAGWTSTGYFLTRQGLGEVDIVGAGYPDAGVLLEDHGAIAISPGGELLVTPSSEFVPAIAPTRPARGDHDPPPLHVAGLASHYSQFGGEPVPYVVGGVPLRIDEVVAYAPGSASALVVGRLGSDRLALWEVPIVVLGGGPETPRYLAEVAGFTAAAYANDGTAFVVTHGGLWRLRNHRLTPLEIPEGAPIPTGPIAWILREPTTEL